MTLDSLDLTYEHPGDTDPAAPRWSPPPDFRVYESHTSITAPWDEAAALVLAWGIKTRSGFAISPPTDRLALGDRFHLVARIGPISVREPVEVVAVVDTPDRVGFAYGTLRGHPVSGEEAFVVWRDADGHVWLTLRSLTRRGRGLWGAVFPLLLIAQRWYRHRYRRALGRAPRSP